MQPGLRAFLFLAPPAALLGYLALPFPLTLCALAVLSAAACLPMAFAHPLKQAVSWQLWQAWRGMLCGRSNVPKDQARLLVAWTALSGLSASLLVYFLAFEAAFRTGQTASRPEYHAAQLLGIVFALAYAGMKLWSRKVLRSTNRKRA